MLDALCEYAAGSADETATSASVRLHEANVVASAGQGDASAVARAEEHVKNDPQHAFAFAPDGSARLVTPAGAWAAGRFETPTIAELRARALAVGEATGSGGVRLSILDGRAACTDIGALQATSGRECLFQVASQFNCLEAPGPFVTSVAEYLHDPTQGPRASVSAFPATLLRHYAAPSPEGRFVQATDAPQIDLLREVCAAGAARVRNGYLRPRDVTDPEAFAHELQQRFDGVRVGVHAEVEVALGYDWRGGVPRGGPCIDQVFTSTLAAGAYGRLEPRLLPICEQLLRAAYLGTLLATVSLGRTRVVLTLIGGGAFGNPVPLVWESILWAVDAIDVLAPGRELHVFVNGREGLAVTVPRDELLRAVRARQGVLASWAPDGALSLRR